jgi:hypothetical protein
MLKLIKSAASHNIKDDKGRTKGGSMADANTAVQTGGQNDIDVEEGTCLSTLSGHTG